MVPEVVLEEHKVVAEDTQEVPERLVEEDTQEEELVDTVAEA